MHGDLEFDRVAVGVSARADWHDCETFAQLGAYIGHLTGGMVASVLPAGENLGTARLGLAISIFNRQMSWVLGEYSDACAVLGSGQETAIRDHDATEEYNEQNMAALAARLGGVW